MLNSEDLSLPYQAEFALATFLFLLIVDELVLLVAIHLTDYNYYVKNKVLALKCVLGFLLR